MSTEAVIAAIVALFSGIGFALRAMYKAGKAAEILVDVKEEIECIPDSFRRIHERLDDLDRRLSHIEGYLEAKKGE